MFRICLVFPRSTFLEDPMVMPPLGLWYLAAQLEAQGHTTDFRALDVDELPEDGEFDHAWISATSSQMHEVRRLATLTLDWTKTATVFGGAAAWANPGECSKLLFSLIVSGESDHPDSVQAIAAMAGRGRQQAFAPAITPGELTWALPPIRRWDG